MVTRETNGSYTVTFGNVAMPLNNQKIVHVPATASVSATAASSETSQLEEAKATWKTTIEKIKTDAGTAIKELATNPKAIDMKGARALTKSLLAAKTNIDRAIDAYQSNQNKADMKDVIKMENAEVNMEITKVFTKLKELRGNKGGRRTKRKQRKYMRRTRHAYL